jgi:hypothetical protein
MLTMMIMRLVVLGLRVLRVVMRIPHSTVLERVRSTAYGGSMSGAGWFSGFMRKRRNRRDRFWI